MRRLRRLIVLTAFGAGAVLASPGLATAGPPLICHPFETGKAALLPWGSGPGWNTPDTAYDSRQLTKDVLALLTPDAPVLARMENMRRATIYASRDSRAASELLAAVAGRAFDAEAKGEQNPLAWFDVGYLIESYKQARVGYAKGLSSVDASSSARATELAGADGYALVRKALELGGSSPEMEFAASLMKEGAISVTHRRRAVAGAKAGSLLARNLVK